MLGTKRLLDSLLVRSTQSEVVTAHNYSIQEPTNRAGNIQDEGSCSGQPASLCKAKFASLSCKDPPPQAPIASLLEVRLGIRWTFWECALGNPLTSKPVQSLHLEFM